MIEAAVGAFGGGSVITAVLMIIIKLWDRKKESDQQKHIMRGEISEQQIKALDATGYRTNNWVGNVVRLMLAVVPQFVMLALLYIGYNNPEVVIWVSHQEAPKEFSFLFGIVEFTIPQEMTWRAFSGIVVIPAMFAQMGAVNTYFLIGGTFSRR